MNLSKFLTAGFIWCGVLLSFNCYGQNGFLEYPLGALPMQYNPSFAGETGAGRLSTSSSYQIYTLAPTSPDAHRDHNFSTYSSYDQFIPGIGTGIGITTGYLGVRGLNAHLNAYYISAAIAPKISIKGKYTLSPSLDLSFLPYRTLFNGSSNPSTTSQGVSLSSKAGLLFNSNKYYIGYSVVIFIRNKVSLPEKTTFYYKDFLSYLQFGYTFQRSPESKFSFTPQFALSLSEKRHPDDDVVGFDGINLNFKYTQYIGGFNNSGVHLGYQNEKMRLMVSKSINNLIGIPGSFNLSFRYIFKQDNQNRGWY